MDFSRDLLAFVPDVDTRPVVRWTVMGVGALVYLALVTWDALAERKKSRPGV